MIDQTVSHHKIFEHLGDKDMRVGEFTKGRQNAQTTF
jgi:hypothetical protein